MRICFNLLCMRCLLRDALYCYMICFAIYRSCLLYDVFWLCYRCLLSVCCAMYCYYTCLAFKKLLALSNYRYILLAYCFSLLWAKVTACLTEVVAWLTSAKISYTGVHTQLQVNNEVLQYLRHNYIIVVTWVKVTILIRFLFMPTIRTCLAFKILGAA